MVQILRTPGLQFRVVGTLDVANEFFNPSFEDLTSTLPSFWSGAGGATIASDTSTSKFGTKSCLVTIPTKGIAARAGLAQQVDQSTIGGSDYTISVWIQIDTDLSEPLNADVDVYDIDGEFVQTLTAVLSTGSATDWTQVSNVFTMPSNAFSVIVTVNVVSTSADAFRVDGAMWMPFSASNQMYMDGDISGFVWANDDAPNCITLMSNAPDALTFFAIGSGTPTPVSIIA